MSPRLLVTAALLPLAALGALLAPALHAVDAAPALPAPAVPPVTEVGAGQVHLTATPDRNLVYAGDRLLRVKVDLWADPSEREVRVPTDLIVVLDRSGSMSGEKLLDAKAAAHELVSTLGPDDRFGLVTFDDSARVDARPGSTPRDRWDSAIDQIEAGSSTNLSDGLRAGLGLVEPTPGRARRVVLISDGRPDSEQGLDALAQQATRSETPLSAIGIGADYDEVLMQRLADLGTGNFHWVTRGPDLGQALASELSTARETVGTGLSLAVSGGAQIVDAGGVPTQAGAVPLGTLFAGQHRTLWVTVALPPNADGSFDLGTLTAIWRGPDEALTRAAVELPAVQLVADPQLAYRGLGDAWAEGTVNDQYNDLRTRVSAAVQAGDQAAALGAIRQYEQQTALMNGYANNAVVADNLREVQQLTVDVNDNFNGADQAQRQNAWAKGTRIDAYSKRRVGQLSTSTP